jgi:Na+-transporting methylmalonyl-CoA/oxaloacetate decarboxylase gamma subunit
MAEYIVQNNGFTIALSGILVVFAGLVLIALAIHLFNKLFAHLHRQIDPHQSTASHVRPKRSKLFRKRVNITDEELAAISVAIECYRKLHFERLQSQITFKHGEQQNPWIIGQRVGALQK